MNFLSKLSLVLMVIGSIFILTGIFGDPLVSETMANTMTISKVFGTVTLISGIIALVISEVLK